jgi:hypothetical protein
LVRRVGWHDAPAVTENGVTTTDQNYFSAVVSVICLRSECTVSCAGPTLTSFCSVAGHPPCGASATDSRPFFDQWCHTNTLGRDTSLFTTPSICSGLVADSLSRWQNVSPLPKAIHSSLCALLWDLSRLLV